jgi:rubredoxin
MNAMPPQADNSDQWVCMVCGYVYDPALHEGVAFRDQPADWRCPGCGFGKSVFRSRAELDPPAGPTRRDGLQL